MLFSEDSKLNLEFSMVSSIDSKLNLEFSILSSEGSKLNTAQKETTPLKYTV